MKSTAAEENSDLRKEDVFIICDIGLFKILLLNSFPHSSLILHSQWQNTIFSLVVSCTDIFNGTCMTIFSSSLSISFT